MIDIRKLKELVRLMVENDLTELDLRDSEEQVTMRRPNAASQPVMMMPHAGPMVHAGPGGAVPGHGPAPASNGSGGAAGSALGKAAAGTPSDEDAGLIRIDSPMVGTFYATPNPDSPPFAAVGVPISPDKVVCIIEAMKIFNEIKAECSGVIHRVMVKSGEPVEFGQTLFLVKPG